MSEIQKEMKVDFPPNSRKYKDEPKRIERVVTTMVVRQKKPLGKKFMELFSPDDTGGIVNYIVYEVLIPSAKNMLFDMVKGSFDLVKTSVEASIFGEVRNQAGSRDRNKPYVSYNACSSNNRPEVRQQNPRNRMTHEFDDIVIPSRIEAQTVLDDLVELISKYGEASVYDLYDAVGIQGTHPDKRYGWTNLSTAAVRPVRTGYLLDLPKTKVLD